MGLGNFVGSFADALSQGLDRQQRAAERAEDREARRRYHGEVDYGPIDRKHGVTTPGVFDNVSDWLHRNTGGILGRASGASRQPWDEKVDFNASAGTPPLDGGSAVSLPVVVEHRGGTVPGYQRGYRDGGGVVRSFAGGGMEEDQPRFDLGDAYSGDPRFDRDASIRAYEERQQQEDLERRIAEQQRGTTRPSGVMPDVGDLNAPIDRRPLPPASPRARSAEELTDEREREARLRSSTRQPSRFTQSSRGTSPANEDDLNPPIRSAPPPLAGAPGSPPRARTAEELTEEREREARLRSSTRPSSRLTQPPGSPRGPAPSNTPYAVPDNYDPTGQRAAAGVLAGESNRPDPEWATPEPRAAVSIPAGRIPVPSRDEAPDFKTANARAVAALQAPDRRVLEEPPAGWDLGGPAAPPVSAGAPTLASAPTAVPVPAGAVPYGPKPLSPREQAMIEAQQRGRAEEQNPPPATTSEIGRWVRGAWGNMWAERAHTMEIGALRIARGELTAPWRQETEQDRRDKPQKLAEIDKAIAEKTAAGAPRPGDTPLPGAPTSPPAGSPTPSRPPASSPTPRVIPPGGGLRVIRPPAPVVPPPNPRDARTAPFYNIPTVDPRVAAQSSPPGTVRPGAPPPAQATTTTAGAPPPQAPRNASPTVPTGGGTGAAPTVPPPPTAPSAAPSTAPQTGPASTRTAAYDPTKEGPGNIPAGTIVPGSGPNDKPSAVVLRPDASGQQAKQVVPVDQLTPDEHDMLVEAVTGGVRHLHEHFDQNLQTAVPGAPNPQKAAGRAAMHAGQGAPANGPADVHRVDQALQARGLKMTRLDKWQTDRLVYGYQVMKMRGDTKRADQFAAELLQHHNIMLQKYGGGALDALKRGDPITAEKHIIEGYNIHIPDGLSARKGVGNSVEFVNKQGKVVQRVGYTPQNLWTVATGMANGSLFHAELERRWRNSAEYKQQLKEAKEEENQRRRDDAAARSENRERRAEERHNQLMQRGAGAAAPLGPAPSQIFAEGGTVQAMPPTAGATDPLATQPQAVPLTLGDLADMLKPKTTAPLPTVQQAQAQDTGLGGAATGEAGTGQGGNASTDAGPGGSAATGPGGTGAAGASGSAAAGTSGGPGAGGGEGDGTYQRGGRVQGFEGGGVSLPYDVFMNREATVPAPAPFAVAPAGGEPPAAPGYQPAPLPEIPPPPTPPTYPPPQAVPLVPSVMRRQVDTDEQMAAVNKGREELEYNPDFVPKDVYHQGERVREAKVVPFEEARPDYRKPHDPRVPSDNPADDAFNPGWRERLDELGRQAKVNKNLGQAYTNAKDHFKTRMKEYNDNLTEWRRHESEYNKQEKETRTGIAKERTEQAKAQRGGNLTPTQVAEYVTGVDEFMKNFKPTENEAGQTVYDQVTTTKDGKTKPVIDSKMNRENLIDLTLRNGPMPTDQAHSIYQTLTAFDPDKANKRTFTNKGQDAAGHYIVQITTGPYQGREIYLSPHIHKSLNNIVRARFDAYKQEASKPKPTSWSKGFGQIYDSMFGGSPAATPPPQ